MSLFILVFGQMSLLFTFCPPRQESNLDQELRSLLFYPSRRLGRLPDPQAASGLNYSVTCPPARNRTSNRGLEVRCYIHLTTRGISSGLYFNVTIFYQFLNVVFAFKFLYFELNLRASTRVLYSCFNARDSISSLLVVLVFPWACCFKRLSILSVLPM